MGLLNVAWQGHFTALLQVLLHSMGTETSPNAGCSLQNFDIAVKMSGAGAYQCLLPPDCHSDLHEGFDRGHRQRQGAPSHAGQQTGYQPSRHSLHTPNSSSTVHKAD